MRISWLEPAVIRATRNALLACNSDWSAHFTPQFTAPPAPASVDADHWPHIAEHVARAERVSKVVRQGGVDGAVAEFGASRHAIELATVIAAAVQVDKLTLELCESLFSCPVDELIAYGTFLQLLIEVGGQRHSDRVVAAYEGFCSAATAKRCAQKVWPDRVAAVQDGLASLYVNVGRFEDADALFDDRHRADPEDLVPALTASRSYLSAGSVARAIMWLGRGEERARENGRDTMADRLAKKQTALKKRLS